LKKKTLHQPATVRETRAGSKQVKATRRIKVSKVTDPRPRLTNITGAKRVLDMVNEIRKIRKLKVDQIWMGGGGNPGLHCEQMCRALLTELAEHEGIETGVGDWEREELAL
jgi:hypothetical protein